MILLSMIEALLTLQGDWTALTKIKTLRPDSPTTIQACHETGVLISDLRKK
jgi:hypothetical protein